MSDFATLCQAVKRHMTRARDAPTEADQIIEVSCLQAACTRYLEGKRVTQYNASFTQRISEVTEWARKGKKPKGHLF